MGNSWIDFCEPPRPRPQGIDWDVFVSYRSLDRLWSISLYDMLTQCGYKVFLDQFVLVPGQGLTSQLGHNLQRSASGVLLWSERAEDSKWVEKEIDLMSTKQTNSIGADFPFNFVVASLDGKTPPGLMAGQLYVDFSSYPDGPMGCELVRLTCGLQNKPLSPDAVRQVVAFDAALKTEPPRLRAWPMPVSTPRSWSASAAKIPLTPPPPSSPRWQSICSSAANTTRRRLKPVKP